jgi:predicted pyridoxine 5'-phosphate oxidase superfamily flavin-nucleotide-binding protein
MSILTPGFYHDGNRTLQEQFDTRRLADRLEQVTVKHFLDEYDKEFIESLNMFFIATVDADGRANCSYKGGDTGFVRVIDPHTLAFPNYDGNGMYLTMGNLLQTAEVGMLFIDFERQFRMRVNGEASIDANDSLISEYPEAQFVVRVKARDVFPNCPRYIHKHKLVATSRFVPKEACTTPVPSWKKAHWAADALPVHDVARGNDREVI